MFLRGWGDYQRYGPEAHRVRHARASASLGLRAWSPEALQRRVAAVEATGLGEGWIDGDRGRGAVYRFRDPGRPPLRALLRVRALRRRPSTCARAEERAPALHRPRRGGQAPRPRQRARRRRRRQPRVLPSSARLPPLRADRARRRQRGRRLDERVDRRPRADLHARRAGAQRPAAPPRRSGSTPARSACAPPTCSSTPGPDRGRAVQARDRPGLLPLRHRARRQPRSRSPPAATSSTTRYEPVGWTEAERANGQAWACRPSRASTPTAPRRWTAPWGRRSATSALPTPGPRSHERHQAIRELVENWVVWRDAGDWERFRTVWHDDG